MSELVLWFAKSQGQIQLERTVYVEHSGAEVVAIRGKNPGAYKGAGVFQWTPGVRALAVVFLTALVRHLKQINTFLPLLEGEKGSLAFSLYYALAKQPAWLFEMFGSDEDENARLRKLLFQSNLGTGKVALSLNEQFLLPNSIRVFLANVELKNAEELECLVNLLTDDKELEPQQEMNNLWTLLRSDDPVVAQKCGPRPTALSYFEPDSIYLFEQLQFPSNSIADRLNWDQTDSNGQRPQAICGRIVQAKHIFEELTYTTCDDRTRNQFEDWLANMKPYPDGEWGIDTERENRIVPGYRTCIREYNKAFSTDGFHRTFIWRDRSSKEIVATLTLGTDDRGVCEQNQLYDDGHICGVNVRWDLRNRGIGNYVAACVNRHIMDHVKRDGRPRLIHTYNYNLGGTPWPLLKKVGYEIVDSVGRVQTDFGVLPIWSKTYKN